jgi:hypothetical protein
MSKFTQFALLTLTLIFTASQSFAHEGHGHDAPKSVKSNKGGVVKSLEETNIEVVSKGNKIEIYLFNKNETESKPLDVTPFKVSAKAEMPRTKKTEAIVLKPMGNFFEATFDAKGTHRYTLLLSVKDPKTGHDDKLKFTIEPRK